MKWLLVLAFLVWTAPAAWAQGGKYKIEGKASETTVETKGAKRPAFLVEGTTNLPDESRLDAYVYYDKLVVGRSLVHSAVEVKDGKWSLKLPVFAEKTFPGRYHLQVFFDQYLQQDAVRAALGNDLRSYECALELVVGTEADLVKERRRVYARLGSEIDALRAIGDDIAAKLEEAKKKFDKPAWKKLCEDWREREHEIEKRAHAVAEYKALNIDDIAEQTMDDFAQCVDRLIETATLVLEEPASAKERQEMFDQHRAGFDRMRRPVAQRLGLEKASKNELLGVLKLVREQVANGLDLYAWIRGSEKKDIDAFRGQAQQFRKHFKEMMLAFGEVAAAPHQEGISKLSAKGLDFFRKLEEAVDLKEDQSEPLKKMVEDFVRDADALGQTFKD